jgi:hypothetical protein
MFDIGRLIFNNGHCRAVGKRMKMDMISPKPQLAYTSYEKEMADVG